MNAKLSDDQTGFNSHDASDDEILTRFDSIRLAHPRAKDLLGELELATDPRSGVDIVLLLGPSGVGKSTMMEIYCKKLAEKLHDELLRNASLVPFISVEVPSPGVHRFAWQFLYAEMAAALELPSFGTHFEVKSTDVGQSVLQYVGKEPTLAALRRVVENGLRHRGTQAVFLDEAVHIVRASSATTLPIQMDTLKSLANLNGTTFVLMGSYDLLSLLSLNGQLARRMHLIHFPRYQLGVEADRKAFLSVLRRLEKELPLDGVPSLADRGDEFFERTLGCVGVLKKTLQQTLIRCLHDGRRWNEKHLKSSFKSRGQLATMLQEIQEGENRLLAEGYLEAA